MEKRGRRGRQRKVGHRGEDASKRRALAMQLMAEKFNVLIDSLVHCGHWNWLK